MIELRHLPTTASADEMISVIRSDAALIIDDVLSEKTIDKLLDELRPHIDQTAASANAFSGTNTTRTGGLVARSPAARAIIQHPLAMAAANGFLKSWCSRIQLHLTQVIRLLPEQGAQPLHRDRLIWGEHLVNVEPQLNCMWALTEFTVENGATQVVPGSQSWPTDRQALPHEICQAAMSRGSVLFFTGSVLHGGGSNQSVGERIGLNIDYSLAWLRQEENQYLSCPPELALALDPDLQDLLGYTMGGFGLGYYTSLDKPGVQAPEAAVGRQPREQLSYPGPI